MDAIAGVDLAALGIVKYPNPVLSQVCAEVTQFGGDLKALAVGMFQVMYAVRGVGLAAPQVGVPIRMFVFNPDLEPGPGEKVCVNPRIVDQGGLLVEEEGCLSLPGVTCKTKRFAAVTLRALDLEGKALELRGEGLPARIFQHEVDHLNGVLLIARMSPVGKLANRRALRELEEAYQKRPPK